MWYFPFSAAINFLISIFCGIYIFKAHLYPDSNKIFSIFCFTVAFWAFGYFFWQISTTPKEALFWSRIVMLGATWISTTYFHFAVKYTYSLKKYKQWIFLGYSLSFLFSISVFTKYFISKVEPRMFFKFWPVPNILFHPLLLMFVIYIFYSQLIIWQSRKYHNGNSIVKNQSLYMIIGATIGFISGSTNYLLFYNIQFPPYLNILVILYLVAIVYSLTNYLSDFRMTFKKILNELIYLFAVTIIAIFIINKIGHNVSVLATFVFLYTALILYGHKYLVKKLNKNLNQNMKKSDIKEFIRQIKYLSTSKEVIEKMIVFFNKSFHLKNSTFFMRKKWLKHFKEVSFSDKFPHNIKSEKKELNLSNPAISYLNDNYLPHTIIMKDLLTLNNNHKKNQKTNKLFLNLLETLNATILCPFYFNRNLIGLLFLGEKTTKNMFSNDEKIIIENTIEAIEQKLVYTMSLEYQEHLLSISKSMIAFENQAELFDYFTRTLMRYLEVNYVAIYLYEPQNQLYALKFRQGNSHSHNQKELCISENSYLIKILQERNSAIYTSDLKTMIENFPTKDLQCMLKETEKLAAECIIPLNQDSLEGFIVIGGKHDQTYFNKDDIEIINIFNSSFNYSIEKILLTKEATKDGLTKLHNRKYFTRKLNYELKKSLKTEEEFNVVFIDIDNFKQCNDTVGHNYGDKILTILGQYLLKFTRPEDHTCRYGGEEFAIILPETTAENAQNIMNRIRIEFSQIRGVVKEFFKELEYDSEILLEELYKKKIIDEYDMIIESIDNFEITFPKLKAEDLSKIKIIWQEIEKKRVTLSIGICPVRFTKKHFRSLNFPKVANQVISLADQAMYTAKKTGKNKVCLADNLIL
ncbi:MAG: diguanylate cyclase [bacterium]|nr:diguanylate cyclase [bacterium]